MQNQKYIKKNIMKKTELYLAVEIEKFKIINLLLTNNKIDVNILNKKFI